MTTHLNLTGLSNLAMALKEGRGAVSAEDSPLTQTKHSTEVTQSCSLTERKASGQQWMQLRAWERRLEKLLRLIKTSLR